MGRCCRYCVRGRLGETGAQATEWVSDSSVVCKMAAGAFSSMAVAATAGDDVGSISGAMSYSLSVVSAVTRSNEGTSGGESVTLVGAALGTSRFVRNVIFSRQCLSSRFSCKFRNQYSGKASLTSLFR